MTFAYPWVLLLLPMLFWLFRRPMSRRSVITASEHLWPEKRTKRVRFLWCVAAARRLALCLFVVAMARPQAGSSFDVQVNEGIAIELLVDVSSSMDMNVKGAEGKRVSRMEVAKEMVTRFIAGDGEQLHGRPNDLIGLITFARYADTRSPLTFGHEALLQIVENISIQDRPNEDGTAYGDALAIASARLKDLEELRKGGQAIDVDAIQSRVIILLTDGENNSGAHLPIEAAGLAKEWGCRIYAISLGDAPSARTGDVAVETLSAAEKVLEHISIQTGGIFRQAHDFESLNAVYQQIDELERSRLAQRSIDRVADWFWLPLALGILALVLSLILEATWLRVAP